MTQASLPLQEVLPATLVFPFWSLRLTVKPGVVLVLVCHETPVAPSSVTKPFVQPSSARKVSSDLPHSLVAGELAGRTWRTAGYLVPEQGLADLTSYNMLVT